MARLKRDEAPGELELVRAFVNTLDVEDGEERLDSPQSLQTWLADRGLIEAGDAATVADLRYAIGLREALRALMLANAGGPPEPDAAVALDEVARRAQLGVGFAPDGSVRLEPSAPGVEGALGRLVARVARAMSEGRWSRLKACGDDHCRWAFYDHTKNGSGVWCDMAVCGNRAKARAYRERHARG
jgi:predicted RNA-binding Zn ribbon-like protein